MKKLKLFWRFFTAKEYRSLHVGALTYFIMYVVLILPAWVPKRFLITHKGTDETIFNSFWLAYIIAAVGIVFFLAILQLMRISEWIAIGRKKKQASDIWIAIMYDIKLREELNSTLNIKQDDKFTLVLEWVRKYKIEER